MKEFIVVASLLEILARDVNTSSSVGRKRVSNEDVVDAWSEVAAVLGECVGRGGDVDCGSGWWCCGTGRLGGS
jgi:hypothetical protein